MQESMKLRIAPSRIAPDRIAPELKQIVAEASQALACLNARRLEELAACCRALIQDLPPQPDLARQARESAADMATLARVLEATRANIKVMRRLRELRQGAVEYAAASRAGWGISGGRDGDH